MRLPGVCMTTGGARTIWAFKPQKGVWVVYVAASGPDLMMLWKVFTSSRACSLACSSGDQPHAATHGLRCVVGR